MDTKSVRANFIAKWHEIGENEKEEE